MHFKLRRPEIFDVLTDPKPPVMEEYKNIHLTTGDKKRQLEAVKKVDYGAKK